MKLSLLLSAVLLASAPVVVLAQGDAPVVEKSPADIDHDAVWEIWRSPLPEGLTSKDREFWLQRDPKVEQFVAAARRFAEKYPDDPRRYNGWVQSSFTPPLFVVGFKPEFDAKPNSENVIVDTAKRDRFRAEQDRLLRQVVMAPDAEVRQRGGAIFALVAEARTLARENGTKPDFGSLEKLVKDAVARLQDERVLPLVETMGNALRSVSEERAAAFEAEVGANPKIAAAIQQAREEREAAAAKAQEDLKRAAADLGSLKFTAADGREVDLQKLRGKVVLVDFWATWCGPCIAELPNIKKVYAQYHDKGFEIIGITLENPNARPNDTAEQTARKLEAAKAKMLEFAAKNEMPWPQYFDGKWWKNDYAVKYGINAIPAMFLLGKDGRIVTTEARGEKLEAEVKRLLGV